MAVVAVGTVHTIIQDLHVVEGHHPQTLWEDPDIPSIVVYRTGRRLYVLDSGFGPDQRQAISELGRRYADTCDEVVLLNSHGHCDHLGNNDVISEIGSGKTVRHYVPRAARASFGRQAVLRRHVPAGVGYFDYVAGLTVPADAVASLLRSFGASQDLTGQDVGVLGAKIEKLGMLPAFGGFMPSLVVDILIRTYPPTFPDVETMIDYEDISPPRDIRDRDDQLDGLDLPRRSRATRGAGAAVGGTLGRGCGLLSPRSQIHDARGRDHVGADLGRQ